MSILEPDPTAANHMPSFMSDIWMDDRSYSVDVKAGYGFGSHLDIGVLWAFYVNDFEGVIDLRMITQLEPQSDATMVVMSMTGMISCSIGL